MGEYLRNYDYYITIDSLRDSCKYYPLELQLIWLLEILLLSSYISNRASCKVSKQGRHLFYFKDLLRLSKKFMSDYELEALYTLIKFRNVYVHEGALAARDYFSSLVNKNRDSVLRLAELARVELHMSITLYDTFGIIV